MADLPASSSPAFPIASASAASDHDTDIAINTDRGYTANGLNQYSAVAGASFIYDANGNLTSDGANSYIYDVENRLVSRGGGASASLRYDPLGRLYEVGGSSGTTRFLHDGSDLAAEYDASGNLLRRYVHGPSEGRDDPLVWFEGAGVADSARRYLFTDERGSVVAVTDGNGNALAIDSYDEYGIPAATNQGRFQYTGQAWLPELGMYYYKARMYSPTLGRFMQTDPIDYADGMNMYAYVGGDPINGVDPTGLFHEMTDAAETVQIVVIGKKLPPLTFGGGAGFFWGPGLGVAGPSFLGAGSGGGGAPGAAPQNEPSPTKPCPVGINERNYPIPPGYKSAGQNGNRFVRDSKGTIQMNPNYAAARASAQGVDKAGVFWDLATILFGSVTGGLFGQGVKAVEAAIVAVGGSTTATGSELAKSDGC